MYSTPFKWRGFIHVAKAGTIRTYYDYCCCKETIGKDHFVVP